MYPLFEEESTKTIRAYEKALEELWQECIKYLGLVNSYGSEYEIGYSVCKLKQDKEILFLKFKCGIITTFEYQRMEGMRKHTEERVSKQIKIAYNIEF